MRTRTQLINLLRAQLRQEGYRLPSGAAEAAVARYRRLPVPEALTTTLAPVLTVLEGLAPVLDAADAEATAAAAADPVVTRLMTVPGVGPITALTFRAALDDVTRFADAKAVARTSGWCPGKTARGPPATGGDYQGRAEERPDPARAKRVDGLATAPPVHRVTRVGRATRGAARATDRGRRPRPSTRAHPLCAVAGRHDVSGGAARLNRGTQIAADQSARRGVSTVISSVTSRLLNRWCPPRRRFACCAGTTVPSLSTNRRMSKRARMHDRRFGRTRGSQRRLTSRAAS